MLNKDFALPKNFPFSFFYDDPLSCKRLSQLELVYFVYVYPSLKLNPVTDIVYY